MTRCYYKSVQKKTVGTSNVAWSPLTEVASNIMRVATETMYLFFGMSLFFEKNEIAIKTQNKTKNSPTISGEYG